MVHDLSECFRVERDHATFPVVSQFVASALTIRSLCVSGVSVVLYLETTRTEACRSATTAGTLL
jgi:hypothetical protein